MSQHSPPTSAAVIENHLRTHIAPRFSQAVADAVERLGEAAVEVIDLRAARGAIAWEVEGPDTPIWYLNISDGTMTVGSTPIEAPFMHVAQSRADWERFVAGVTAPGFLGAGGRRGLGKNRIERLRSIHGGVRFTITGITGGGDWTFVTRFGSGPFPPEPQSTVTVDAKSLEDIQSGKSNPQMAFMQGRIRISGDVALAIQLGTALFS